MEKPAVVFETADRVRGRLEVARPRLSSSGGRVESVGCWTRQMPTWHSWGHAVRKYWLPSAPAGRESRRSRSCDRAAMACGGLPSPWAHVARAAGEGSRSDSEAWRDEENELKKAPATLWI
jgi:hypothetical protein